VFIVQYPEFQKQLSNCLKIAETSIVLNVFKGVICCLTGIRYQNSYILVSDRMQQTFIQSMQFDCSNRTSRGQEHLSNDCIKRKLIIFCLLPLSSCLL